MSAQMQATQVPSKRGGNHGGGRPTILTEALAAQICELVGSGHTLRQTANKLDLHGPQQICLWAMRHDWFNELYARAKELRLELMAAEIEEIADEGTNDYYQREGVEAPDHEHMARSRLRVDTRKWLLSKLAPKVYGDKVQAEISGKDGAPLAPAVSVVIGAVAAPEIMPAIEMPRAEIAAPVKRPRGRPRKNPAS